MSMALDLTSSEAPDGSRSDGAPDGAGAPDAAGAAQGLLRFITCGSVDDGKSTLIGRLLFDSKSIFEDQLETLASDSRRFGTQGEALDLALLVDGLSAEREQGITIDVAYRYFSTPRRSFIVADTPGHEQYTRNMATGASTADLAVILIDARKGILPQTRRHSFIVSMLGVRHVAVAINKMDLIDFDQGTYERICAVYRGIAAGLGFEEISFFPISARDGDNVARLSPRTPWHTGRALLDFLETVTIEPRRDARDLLFPVQWVNRPDADFRGYSGWVARGRVRAGDDVVALPSGAPAQVSRIVTYDGDPPEAAQGQSVTLTLDREIDVSRGDVLVSAPSGLRPRRNLRARLLWTGETPFAPGETYALKLGAALAQARLEVEQSIDIHTFESLPTRALAMNGIADAVVSLDRDVVALPYAESHDLGGFILIDKKTNQTVAFGLVSSEAAPESEANKGPLHAGAAALALYVGADQATPSRQDIVVFVATVLASALVVLFLTRSPWIALVFAVIDMLLRPLVRRGLAAVFAARARRRSDDLNSDGAGI